MRENGPPGNLARIGGHAWTVGRVLRRFTAPPRVLPSVPWSVRWREPAIGEVELSGRLRRAGGSSTLLILVHGLGGMADSPYMLHAAACADRAGMATLRLNLRGADRRGRDFYHAGLSEDLARVLESPELRVFDTVLCYGFSMGGHLALRYATETDDPRFRAVAAVCAPLDLERCVARIDRPRGWLYRRYVMSGLRRMYAEIAARRPVPVAPARLRGVRTFREWDRRTVIPRFGFDSPEDYYRRASVAGRIARLRVPALLVAAQGDPIVPAESVRPVLDDRPPNLEVRWVRRGGHLHFPAALDLGEKAPPGIDSQVLAWLRRQARI